MFRSSDYTLTLCHKQQVVIGRFDNTGNGDLLHAPLDQPLTQESRDFKPANQRAALCSTCHRARPRDTPRGASPLNCYLWYFNFIRRGICANNADSPWLHTHSSCAACMRSNNHVFCFRCRGFCTVFLLCILVFRIIVKMYVHINTGDISRGGLVSTLVC